MRNWDSGVNNDYLGNPNLNNDICPQEQDYLDAVEVCKKILFPSGFWVDLDKNVYTPEISPLYRERTTKMGPLKPENCPMVGRKRLELLTFSV